MNKTRFFRKGLVLLCLLMINLSQGQTINTTYKTQTNATFAGLDKTKIPNKLLINQAMEFAELTDYSGALSTTNWTTKGKLTDIYNTLLMSRVQTSVPGLASPISFQTNWDNLREPSKIVLSGLYYKYSKFRSDCYPNYLVNNAGVITDKYVGGVWQNPYIDQQVFAIAPPILIYKSLSLQVTLPAALWYTNQSASVQSIEIDFGDGLGYQIMTLGQIRTLNYSASGIYEWKYKLTLTNAQILYSHSKLKIDIPAPLTPPTAPAAASSRQSSANTTSSSCPDVIPVPFTGTRQYLGTANSATLQIKYSINNTDCKIHKPLIVVEGFDSGLLGIENPFGEVSYRNFDISTYKSPDLYFELINYDIIYINFNKGRDDLKRNAYLVEDIIKDINTEKASVGSTTPNVVIGQSMGGVIARYALRDMELLGQAHQTSLFVSHDAPQQGANIPLGIQYFARHLADQYIDTPLGDYKISLAGNSGSVSIEDLQNLLESQGTKQLLSNYIDSGFNLNNTTFDSFQTELHNLGYPTQTRNIALSNGNHCANPQEFIPSTTLFSLSGGASTTALTTSVLTYLQPLTGIAFTVAAYEFNEPGLLLGILPGSSSFAMNFNANALPTAGTSNQIYHGSISYTKKIFSLFGWDPKITVNLTDRNYNNPVALSYDYYPGGKYQLPIEMQTPTLSPTLQLFINLGISVYLAPSFDFIPVPSALDIGGGLTPLNDSDYLKKYNSVTPPVAPKFSPFVNFTTSFPDEANINEPHISFNKRNGYWLSKEIDDTTNNNETFDCTYICSDSQVSGSTLLCSTSTYSAPTGASIYNWTITQGSNLVTLTGNGTSNLTLTPLANVSGAVTLSLSMGDNGAKCGNIILTKTIWVGNPSFNISRASTEEETCDTKYHYIKYVIGNRQPLETYSVQLYVTGMKASFIGDDRIMLTVPKNYVGWIEFLVKGTNSCGSTSYFMEDYINLCGAPANLSKTTETEPLFEAYPNPSEDIVNIDLRNQNNQPVKGAIISGELFDIFGLPKSNVKIIENKAIINVKGLPKGIYILNITINDKLESHKIIVE